jgi:hypothetical protein
VYGGAAPVRPAPARPVPPYQSGGSPLESSGSLTGHILSQGSDEDEGKGRSGSGKVILILSLIMVVIAALAAVAFANTHLFDVIKDVISGK